MRRLKLQILLIALFSVFAYAGFAADNGSGAPSFKVPELTGPVVDDAGIIDPAASRIDRSRFTRA